MSHRPQRKEKNCLNCGTGVVGKYCHNCGQENIEPKQTFWHLVTHFVYDVTHFDGKFFSTVKFLLFKPGFLSLEYIRGRRNSYLEPVKMYVFTSAIFFLFFFSVFKSEQNSDIKRFNNDSLSAVKTSIEKSKQLMEASLTDKSVPDSIKIINKREIAFLEADLNELRKGREVPENLHYFKNKGSNAKENNALDSLQTDTLANDDEVYYKGTDFVGQPDSLGTIEQYDSTQNTLPNEKRDGWFKQKINRRLIQLEGFYKKDKDEFLKAFVTKLYHLFPQMLFVSLPFFALFLQLLYRKRKQLYYADYVIYSIHLYCALFMLIFLELTFSKLAKIPYLGWVSYLKMLMYLSMFFYVYKAMRNFFKQGRAKTLVKYFILAFASGLLLLFLFICFVIFSAYTL